MMFMLSPPQLALNRTDRMFAPTRSTPNRTMAIAAHPALSIVGIKKYLLVRDRYKPKVVAPHVSTRDSSARGNTDGIVHGRSRSNADHGCVADIR